MLREREETLYKALHDVLVRESDLTTTILEEWYGLGTEVPSDFLLELLGQIDLPGTCSFLSIADKPEGVNGTYLSSREKLESALIRQGCKAEKQRLP